MILPTASAPSRTSHDLVRFTSSPSLHAQPGDDESAAVREGEGTVELPTTGGAGVAAAGKVDA
jgi:hypothetical protein